MTQFALAHPWLMVLTTLSIVGTLSYTATYIAILKYATKERKQ